MSSGKSEIIVIGGNGDLGKKKIQPALRFMRPGIADCLELSMPTGNIEPYATWYGSLQASECWKRIQRGEYKVVYLATPPSVTGQLLAPLAESGAKRVVVEKCWFPDFVTAWRIAPRIEESPVSFRFMDHYLHKGIIVRLLETPLESLLGSPITKISGWLLEPDEPESFAMSVGALHDQLTHLVTICSRLCPSRIKPRVVQAARYRGAPHLRETFVDVDAVVGEDVSVNLTAAKGYPAEAAGKVLVAHSHDSILWVDLASNTAELFSNHRTCWRWSPEKSTLGEPYLSIFSMLANDREIGIDIREAMSILAILNEAQQGFPKRLPLYEKGDYPPAWPAGKAA